MPKRYPDKPLRMIIYDSHFIGGIGKVAIGRVVTGTLKAQSIINILLPLNYTVTTRTLEYNHTNIVEANPGSFVSIKVNGFASNEDLPRGQVISDYLKPA